MKKVYSKPDILFEDFSLNVNIAAGCEEKPVNASNGCGVKWGSLMLFTSTLNCKDPIVDGENAYNDLCYHNVDSGYNVFYS